MLPIVNGDVKGEKVSIYNPGVQPKHPLNGLQLTNTTELHLMQGPDHGLRRRASMPATRRSRTCAPGSQRLISYAMDLDTEVAPESKGRPDELLSVRARSRGRCCVEPQVTREPRSTR